MDHLPSLASVGEEDGG
jgi:hypothetical protein